MNLNPFKWTSDTGFNQSNCDSSQKFGKLLIVNRLLKFLRKTNHQWVFVAVLYKTTNIIWKGASIKTFYTLFFIDKLNNRNFIL